MSNVLSYTDLAALLRRLGSDGDAAVFHGALCGALCRARPEEIVLSDLLDDDSVVPEAEAQALLSTALEQAEFALADAENGFSPLLPDDEMALQVRAQALGAWCEGFLFGLAVQGRFDLAGCSDEVREVVQDMTQFTRATFSESDDVEVEESAYAELVEYIRVGAQLVYLELHPRDGDPGDAAPTVH